MSVDYKCIKLNLIIGSEGGLKFPNICNAKLWIAVFFLVGFTAKVSYTDIKIEIEELLDDLEIATSPLQAKKIREEIWRYWIKDHKNKEDRDLIEKGLAYFYKGYYIQADEIFTQIILSDPSYVEGWNKRATIRYLLGDFDKSLQDINEVLIRQPRHFGAISGAGLIHLQNLRFKKALDSYLLLKKIDPKNADSERFIPMLKKFFFGESL